MTEGTPASSSIMLLIKVAVDPCVEYSPRKMEIGMEKTTERTRARKEVASVPTRKGKAPNSFFTGSHVELNGNRIPKFRMEGKDATTRDKNIPTRRSRTNTPAIDSILRKEDSENTGFRQRIVRSLPLTIRTSALL